MTTRTPDQIVKEAMADTSVYKSMAEKESSYWGAILSDADRNERVKSAQQAVSELKMNRKMISLPQYIQEHNLELKKGVVLGCGSGRAERTFIAQGVCETFVGIDIAEDAIEKGRRLAELENLPITYQQADLNFVELPVYPVTAFETY